MVEEAKAVANKMGAVMYLHQIENRGNKAAPRFISGFLEPKMTPSASSPPNSIYTRADEAKLQKALPKCEIRH